MSIIYSSVTGKTRLFWWPSTVGQLTLRLTKTGGNPLGAPTTDYYALTEYSIGGQYVYAAQVPQDEYTLYTITTPGGVPTATKTILGGSSDQKFQLSAEDMDLLVAAILSETCTEAPAGTWTFKGVTAATHLIHREDNGTGAGLIDPGANWAHWCSGIKNPATLRGTGNLWAWMQVADTLLTNLTETGTAPDSGTYNSERGPWGVRIWTPIQTTGTPTRPKKLLYVFQYRFHSGDTVSLEDSDLHGMHGSNAWVATWADCLRDLGGSISDGQALHLTFRIGIMGHSDSSVTWGSALKVDVTAYLPYVLASMNLSAIPNAISLSLGGGVSNTREWEIQRGPLFPYTTESGGVPVDPEIWASAEDITITGAIIIGTAPISNNGTIKLRNSVTGTTVNLDLTTAHNSGGRFLQRFAVNLALDAMDTVTNAPVLQFWTTDNDIDLQGYQIILLGSLR